jgi:hypothetical protein
VVDNPPSWLHATALERRRVWGIFLAVPLLVGLGSIDQRAIFMPWADAEHPMIGTTPTAFFAQPRTLGDGGPGGRGDRPTLGNAFNPPRRFGPASPGSTPGGAAPVELADAGAGLVPDLGQTPFADTGGGVGGPAGSGAGGGPNAGPGLPDAGVASAPIAVTAIPEASTWAMMIIGFGVIGAMIRGRRRRALPVLSPA